MRNVKALLCEMPCPVVRSNSGYKHLPIGKVKLNMPLIVCQIGSSIFQHSPLQAFVLLFPKNPCGKCSCLAVKGMIPSAARGLHLMSDDVNRLQKRKCSDRQMSSRFYFVIPGIYLIPCRMCLWIIHLYKNNIICLRSAYFPRDISKKAVVYCVFLLNVLHHRICWRTM